MCCHNIVTVPFRHTSISRCGLEDFETCSDHLSVFKLSLIQIFAVLLFGLFCPLVWSDMGQVGLSTIRELVEDSSLLSPDSGLSALLSG